MQEIYIDSTNKKDKLHVVIWEPQEQPQAILQISHGMIEYILRYDELAEYLIARGILVIGNDHLGHGLTAKVEDRGYFGPGKSATVVDDLHAVTRYAKEKYGMDLPYFLMGHSMGSFMCRRYLMTYGDELTGAFVVGTGSQKRIVLKFGQLMCKIVALFKSDRAYSDFIEDATFKNNNKRIKAIRTKNDWLTTDDKTVDKYNADALCTFRFTVNGYNTLYEAYDFVESPKNINKIPKDLPVIFMAGTEDPVGAYSKGVIKAYEGFKKAGIKDVDIKLYPGDRHEIFHEKDKLDVFNDVYTWLSKHIV